jgi:ActR/RegA family two-component response regulator
MSRILLIDPEPHLLEALERSLVMAGHRLDTAAGDVDAIRRLRYVPYDVVVTSPATTVEEDLALLDEARAIRPGLRSVVLTGRASRDEVLTALASRVFAVFSQPFDLADIAAMVSGAAASAPGHDGILLVSAVADWVAVRLDCSLLTAERILRFISELRTEVPRPDREGLLIAYREVLLSAIEHGARLAAGGLVDVVGIRTQRAIVFYVKDPGPGFAPPGLPPGISPDGRLLPELEARRAAPGEAPFFAPLVARTIVDEVLLNEASNEVILIKHTA